MRILRVITSMDPASGGPCQGIRNLLPQLEALGIAQEVVCLDAPDAVYLRDNTLPIHALGPAKTSWAYSKALAPWLRERLGDFDAVISHGLWQYPLLAVRQEITRRRKAGSAVPKAFVYPHGMLDPWFQRDPSRRAKAIRNEVYWRLAERRTLNSADGVLFTCEEERRLAGTTFPGYTAKELVVGYGIPSPPTDGPAMKDAFRACLPELADRSYLLFLSRIHPKKGVDLLIRAYADRVRQSSIADRQSSLPSLVIAGPLDSAYAREMQQLAKQLLPSSTAHGSRLTDHPPRIHFPGMLGGDAKWGAFHGCDAFVLPSHQENFGIAVVEALACGKPVLISNKVNIWREIAGASAGIVTEDDAAGTAGLLDAWCGLPAAERVSMAHNARSAYEAHFSIAPAARRLKETLA